MDNLTGRILSSTAEMDDPNFEEVVVLVAQHNAEGALGFVLNRKFGRSLNDLEEFNAGSPFPLFDGGPVDKEHLFFIHRRSDLVDDGAAISGPICLGGNFSQAVSHINSGRLSTSDIKIFVGYCGWDAHELEGEIAEGSWAVESHNANFAFDIE